MTLELHIVRSIESSPPQGIQSITSARSYEVLKRVFARNFVYELQEMVPVMLLDSGETTDTNPVDFRALCQLQRILVVSKLPDDAQIWDYHRIQCI